MSVIIKNVLKPSPAYKAGLRSGDILTHIDNNEIIDVLDYRFYQNSDRLSLSFINNKGKLKTKRVKKGEAEELGLEFETYLMDTQRHCKNKCIFCFIDQLPKGMRESLYFKDDDSRLSFLFGNYITLTNITEHEIERIIKMHISPVNISVHTTNPELRVRMMKNKNAGRVLDIISRFNEASISMNCQLVLVPEYNDGAELKRSLCDLLELQNVKSIAAVPVGITGHREGLEEIKSFDKKSAEAVLDIFDELIPGCIKKYGENRIFPADEFYILAKRDMPSPEFYEDFLQLENGVGLWALMEKEVNEALDDSEVTSGKRNVTTVTGEAAYPLISKLADKITAKHKDIKCNVFCIKNNFFGGKITVAGLVTGADIIEQLKDKDLGEELLIPSVMLRHENDKFLDDVTLDELSLALNVKVRVVNSGGYDFVDAIINKESEA